MKNGTKTSRDFVALEARRREGMRRLGRGLAQADVARQLGVSRPTVLRWSRMRRKQKGGAWKRRRLGRPPKITAAHLERLARLLKQGAQAHGFLNDLWTLPRIAQVLERECGVLTHPAHLWKVLVRLGWSCQRPGGKAEERDEQAIAQWKRYTWPALKKRPGTKAERSSLSTKAD
jgi:transposase